MKDNCNLNDIGSNIFNNKNVNYIGYNDGLGIILKINVYCNKIINNYIVYDINNQKVSNKGPLIINNSVNKNFFYRNTL